MNAPFRLIDRPERRGLKAADFELLIDGGAFAEDGKVELIDGDIYIMNAQYSRHARMKQRLAYVLTTQLLAIGSDVEVLTEVTIHVADDSMPEPNIVLTRYRGDRAVPADTIALVVEIADTTLGNDLGRKVQLYAAAGIAEYWVVDLSGHRVLLHDTPNNGNYARQRDVALGEVIAAATIDGLEIATAPLID